MGEGEGGGGTSALGFSGRALWVERLGLIRCSFFVSSAWGEGGGRRGGHWKPKDPDAIDAQKGRV